jgi:hypothetical protein
MMQHLPGKRVLALVVGLATAAVGSASAQDTLETGQATIDTTAPEAGAIDTSEVDTSATRDTTDTTRDTTDTTRDTTDTSGVQNPPGYRGMERDTTVFPDTGRAAADTLDIDDQTTGTYEDSAWQDTTGAGQNAGTDTTSVGDTEPIEEDTASPRLDPGESAAGDTAGQVPDSTQ